MRISFSDKRIYFFAKYIASLLKRGMDAKSTSEMFRSYMVTGKCRKDRRGGGKAVSAFMCPLPAYSPNPRPES